MVEQLSKLVEQPKWAVEYSTVQTLSSPLSSSSGASFGASPHYLNHARRLELVGKLGLMNEVHSASLVSISVLEDLNTYQIVFSHYD